MAWFKRDDEPLDATSRLVAASKLSRREQGDELTAVGLRQSIAMAVLTSEPARLAATVAEIEVLLGDEANYFDVIDLLEDMQNIASHRHEDVMEPEQVRAALGPRAALAWQGLAQFWANVEAWCRIQSELPVAMTPEEISEVEDTELRQQVMAMFRQVGPEECIGIGHVALYEQSGPSRIPLFVDLYGPDGQN